MDNERAIIGGNNPPYEDPIDALQRKLAEDHGDLLKRLAELQGSADRIPEKIEDDVTAGKLGDLVAMLNSLTSQADAARTAAKRPHLDAGAAVDGFFKRLTDPAAKLKKKLTPRQTIYLDAKAAAAARELAQKAEEMRLQAARDAEAAAQAEAAQRAAREERERIRREEEAAARRVLEERAAAERKAREAAEAAATKSDEEAKAARAEAVAAVQRAQDAERELVAKRTEEAAASAVVVVADKAAAAAEAVFDRALAGERQATRIEAGIAGAAPAELSRTRGDRGSLSTLTRRMTGRLTDRATLNLEALRQHIPEDALEQAIRAFVKAGGRELDGAEIFEDTSTTFAR